LESLLSQSLLRRGEGRDGEARFAMLQTIREFCVEQLDALDESDALRERHAAYFLAVAEEGGGEIELHGARQDLWLDRLEEEHDNLRAALDWSLLRQPGEIPLRFASALGAFWQHHGYYDEGVRLLEACLAAGRGAREALRADALNHIGAILTRQSEFERARPHLESGLAIGRTLGDRAKIARALKSLGLLAQYQGDYATARTYGAEALTIYQALGDRNGIGSSLNNLGIIAFREADYAQARDLYERSLAQYRMQGDQARIANAFNNLALIAHLLGDYASARRLHEEGLAILRRSGEKPTIAMSLTNLGFVCADAGDAGAREMLREGLALYRELGNRLGAARAQLYLELARHYQGESAASYDVLDECLATLRIVGEKHDVADALVALGRVAIARGDLAGAHVHLRDALTIAREFDDRPRIAQHFEVVAIVAARQEAVPRAARLWGAAEAVRRGVGIALAGVHEREHDAEVALAQSRIDAAMWLAAWREGAEMELDRAVAEALAGHTP
jgi:tetratricopeptide (TPR) repeat protein